MSALPEDPVVISTRREVVVVLTVTFIALTYTIAVCHHLGFDPQRELKFVRLFAGIAFPEWVFWGVVVPWLSCFVFGGLFAFFWMSDSDLGEELEEEEDLFAGAPSASTKPADGK